MFTIKNKRLNECTLYKKGIVFLLQNPLIIKIDRFLIFLVLFHISHGSQINPQVNELLKNKKFTDEIMQLILSIIINNKCKMNLITMRDLSLLEYKLKNLSTQPSCIRTKQIAQPDIKDPMIITQDIFLERE